ncbi:MAG TPA: COG3014 family protein [Desulfobacterales bacterium]
MPQPLNATARLLPAMLLGVVLTLLLSACGSRLDHYVRLDRQMYRGDFDSALSTLRDNQTHYASGDAALYYMEEGLLSHYAGRYEESSWSLLQAEAMLDDLYTRSVSRQTASFWINDTTVPYRGENFEDALVNLFLAMNYASLGLHDDALVEARRVDSELAQFQYPQTAEPQDAFVRFIMGVLYEADGELNDAFIAFRNSERIYRTKYLPSYGIATPAVLLEKLLCAATQLGFQSEMDQILQYYPGFRPRVAAAPLRSAEIFLLHYNGPGPEKVETFWTVPMPDGYVAKIAYPQFRVRDYAIDRSRVRIRDRESGRRYDFETEPMEPVGAIAAANLEHRIEQTKSKAVARATVKYLTTKAAAEAVGREAGDSAGALIQLFGNLLGLVTENADIRHWRLLPDEIRLGRVQVPAGGYEGEIAFVDAHGTTVLSETMPPFQVAAGEKKFILRRTLQ